MPHSPPPHDEDSGYEAPPHEVHGGDGYTDFFDLNHPPAAYMPPIGFSKKPANKYKKPKKSKKNKKPKHPIESDYDDYFEPYTEPHKPYEPTKKPYHEPAKVN